MSTAHVYSVNILYMAHPKIKVMPPLCLVLPDKEAYMPRPDGGTVEIDWQLLSPVTAFLLSLHVLRFCWIDVF